MIRLKRRRRAQSSVPELSLTPLIDTALTLLIIFMVTSPIIQNAIRVNLPKGESKEGGNKTQEMVVSVDAKGALFFNNKPTTIEQLGNEVKQCMAKSIQKNASVWVRIDEAKSCGVLVTIIDKIKVVGGVQDVKVALARERA